MVRGSWAARPTLNSSSTHRLRTPRSYDRSTRPTTVTHASARLSTSAGRPGNVQQRGRTGAARGPTSTAAPAALLAALTRTGCSSAVGWITGLSMPVGGGGCPDRGAGLVLQIIVNMYATLLVRKPGRGYPSRADRAASAVRPLPAGANRQALARSNGRIRR